jgi:hypothetical protein
MNNNLITEISRIKSLIVEQNTDTPPGDNWVKISPNVKDSSEREGYSVKQGSDGKFYRSKDKTNTTTPTTGTTTPTTGTTTPTTGTTTTTTGTTVQTDFPLDPKAFTTLGDPYQYKVVDGEWFTKSWKNRGPGRIIKDWISLKKNLKATKILDSRHPDARPKVNVTDNKSSDNKLSDTSKVNVVEPNVSTDEPEIGAKITYVNPNNL